MSECACFLRVCAYARLCLSAYICIHVCIFVCVYVCVCVCVGFCMYMFACVYVCVCVRTGVCYEKENGFPTSELLSVCSVNSKYCFLIFHLSHRSQLGS